MPVTTCVPFRFPASIPEEDVRFYGHVEIDLVWVDRTLVMHVLQTNNCYQNAAFITDKSATRIWKMFVDVWASVFRVYPDVLQVDQEPSFMVSTFRDSQTKCEAIIQVLGVKVPKPPALRKESMFLYDVSSI